MTAHQNSIQALKDHLYEGKITRRARQILECARGLDQPWTDREMRQKLGYADMNAVRPRITELLDAGLLVAAEPSRDDITGKTVRRSRVATCDEIIRVIRRRAREQRTETVQLDMFQ